MANANDTGTQGQGRAEPTDKGEDSEDRRQAAEQAWKDRERIPRGTPEQGGKTADRVGGSGTEQPEPEIENDDVEREGGRAFENDEDVERKKV
jgi:hypothetical protein